MVIHIKRILLFLICILLLVCTSCTTSDKGTSAERTPKILDGVWKLQEPFSLPDDAYASHAGFSGGNHGEVYFHAIKDRFSFDGLCMTYSGNAAAEAAPFPNGGFLAQTDNQNAQMLCFTALPDGGFAEIFDVGKSYVLVITDQNNRIAAQTDIPHFGEYDRINEICYAPAQGTIYFASEQRAAAYSTDGVLLYDFFVTYPIIGLGVSRDGSGYLCLYDLLADESIISVRPFDSDAKKPGDAYLLPDAVNLMNAKLYVHPSYDICWNSGSTVFGCNFLPAGTDPKTVFPTEIINFLNSGIDANIPADMYFLSDDEALLYSYDYHDNYLESVPYYARISRVPKEELKPVFEIIVAACGGGGYEEYARAFNMSQDEFRVVFRTYDTYGYDDPEKPCSAFETDLITGNIPDIVLGNGFFILDEYVHLDLFADMYTYLDADPDFGRDDLHTCVLSPFESDDGTLPYLVDTFYISTVEATAASADQIPAHWSFDDAKKLCDHLGDEGMLFYLPESDGMELLNKLLPVTVTGIFQNGKAERDALTALLSFCREYRPSETLSADERSSMLKSGQILTTLRPHLSSPYQLLDSRWGICGGEMPVYVGFPSAGGNGSAVSMREALAITTATAEHETVSRGAWEFVKFALQNKTYSDQGASITYFHSSKESLERHFDSAGLVYCIHYNADRPGLSYYGAAGHTHNENEPAPSVITFDDDDRDTIRSLIDGITVRADAYPEVCEIIYEEASAYFAGAKTMEETVSVIVSRTELYFSERS